MRFESVPAELKLPWLALRLVCVALLAGLAIYVAIMAFIANAQSGGAQTLLDWTGARGPGARDDESLWLGVLIAAGIIDLLVAFVLHGALLRRPVSAANVPAHLLATPAGCAFVQYGVAKVVGMAAAEGVSVLGLIFFVMFGRFLHVALPALIASAAGMLALFPTEGQLLAHLEEQLGSEAR